MHTKGPWKNAPDMRGIGNVPVVGIVDSYGNAIANLGTQGADNARLICAAPDLLEALRYCAIALKDHCQYDDTDDESSLETKAYTYACEAIAKATGSQP